MAGLPNGFCFICLTRLPNTTQFVLKRSKEIWHKFFTLVSRYIDNNNENISPFEIGATLSKTLSNTSFIPNIGNNPLEKHCCESCLVNLVQFCEVYDNIQVLQLELVRILDKIRNSIRDKGLHGSTNDHDTNTNTTSHRFRERFFEKIEEKRKRSFPRVLLDDIEDINFEPPVVTVNIYPSDISDSVLDDQQLGANVKQEVTINESASSTASHDPNIDTPFPFDDNDDEHDDHAQDYTQHFANLPMELLVAFHGDSNSGHASSNPISSEEFHHGRGSCNKARRRKLQNSLSHTAGKRQMFKCPMCPKSIPRYSWLIQHLRSHTMEKPYHCWKCQKEFRHACQFRDHVQQHHHHDAADPISSGHCDNDNDESFPLPPPVENPKERKFVCEICGETFPAKGNLLRHRSGVHSDIFPEEREQMMKYKCSHESCEKKFAFRCQLQKHFRKHIIGEKRENPFKCSLCEKSFTQRQYLKQHMRTHSGERRFTCMQCGKAFKMKNHLKEHVKRHTLKQLMG